MARRRAGRGPDYTWQGNAGILAIASGSVGILTINQPSVSSTLMRSRGEVLARFDGPVDGNISAISCGLIVGTEEQIVTGVGAFPDPFADMDAEWIWHGFLLLLSDSVVATLDTGHVARLTCDSKAMRKMKQTQGVVFIARATTFSGTPAVDLVLGFRQLFAE